LTDEQQGGPMTPTEATAEAAASEPSVATATVADEPATTADEAPAMSAATEAPATDPTEAAPPAGSPTAEAEAPEAAVAEPADAPAAQSGAEPVMASTADEPADATAEPATDAEAAGAPVAEAANEAPAADAGTEAPAAQAPSGVPAAAPTNGRPAPTGPEPTTMEELLAETDGEIKSFKHGDVVEGTVVRIDKDEILVDIGAKSEGVVSNRELFGRNTETQQPLNVGDTVLVYVLQPESPEGHVVLSLRRAGLERKWRAMQEQFEAGAIIEAPVIDHNKGGLIVDCGIRGFVPISQIVDFPRRPQNDQPRDAAQEIAEKLQPFVGRKLRLKILEVNRKANRLILSEKVALYEERREKRDELFSSLQVGQRVKGTVRSIAPFGVFIDLGGIDGLVHKSELSWNKVNNPEAGYRVGEEVEAEVIDINHERGRISLSIRRLQPDPWHSTVADFKVGDIIEGTVTKLVNFGAFVRVRDGLEGLIHISELSHQRVAHPGDVVHEGQLLKLRIISLESDRHRLGLSLKQAEEAPARPAPEAMATTAAATPAPARPAARPERRERSGRGERERSYTASDAVQEPEGGIDTTLAAAFAGVREQIAAAEAAETPADMAAPSATAEAPAAEAPAAEAPAAEAPAAEAAGAEASAAEDAPAPETGTPAEAAAEPAEAAAEPAEASGAEAPAAEAPAAEAPAAEALAAEAPAAEAPAAEPATDAPASDNAEAVAADAAPETSGERPEAEAATAAAADATDEPTEGAGA
jgi:small subunit ribosomal protein S1